MPRGQSVFTAVPGSPEPDSPCCQTLRSGKGWEMHAHPHWHASLRNDTGVEGEVKCQGCSTLQIRTLSSIAQALAAIAKQILPWQRASPGTGGGAGGSVPGPGWWWGEVEEERDERHRHQHRFCGGRGFRLQSRHPAKSIKSTGTQSMRKGSKRAVRSERETTSPLYRIIHRPPFSTEVIFLLSPASSG